MIKIKNLNLHKFGEKMKNTWKVKPIFKPFSFKLDTDRDGVVDWRDCQPFNPRKQHKKSEKDFTEMTLTEYKAQLKKRKIPFLYTERGWGVYAMKMGNEKVYQVVHMETGFDVLNGRNSLEDAIRDIKNHVPDEVIAEKGGINGTIRFIFYSAKRSVVEEKKYDGREKRFPSQGEQYVLDIGAGSGPDLRATHAIDLRKPLRKFKNLEYEYGYDFNKESTNLPYPDNYFDLVVSYGALGRNFGSKNIYKEIYRVLRPGGRFEANWNVTKNFKKVGFKKISKVSYFNKSLNEKVDVFIAEKGITSRVAPLIKRGYY